MSYRNYIILGMTIIALGVVFYTTMDEEMDTLGTVMVAIGGLALIIGMNRKRMEDRKRQ
jgi:undecaprenyl pyrophosphate phosphatase UppP